MQITFYHWGYQCPIIAEMLELFQEAAMDDVTCIDITGQEKLAFEKQLYYPFLTIFNQQLHWYGPVTAAVLKGGMEPLQGRNRMLLSSPTRKKEVNCFHLPVKPWH